ncbi:MAG: DUF86 domain-containing protein [Chloroflexi bacterium]|nr:DUF86 domain-containing protein [Chloroflexota bacterium]
MNVRTIQARLRKYFKHSRYPVKFAYLFGSHARGQALPFSDVDVGVYLDEPDHHTRFAIFKSLLGDLAHTLHTDDVDLVFLDEAPTRFAYNIIRGKPIYTADEQARTRAETQILSRYFDEDDASEHYNRYLHRHIRAGKMTERTPEMIDPKLVRERLVYIQQMLVQLESYRSEPREQFVTDRKTLDAAAYELQTCIEAMMDISNHIVAALGLEKPPERRDAPGILARHGILPRDLGTQLAEAVSMRNTLVHGYSALIPNKVHETIQEDLGYLVEFSQHISDFLEKQAKKPRAKPKKGAKK